MQVQIIGGRAGRLLPYLLPRVAAAHQAQTRVLMLVPEQYTLQAERELVQGLQLPGLMDIEVLSPKRLNRRIHESGGRSPLAPLDASGRSMAIAQALTMVQDELAYYARVALTPGLPDKLSVLLADLQRAGLSPDELEAKAEAMPAGALKAKTHDLTLIWRTYLSVIDGRFADDAMQQADCLRRLIPSGVMDDAAVFVYGFDVLPEPMCAQLAEAAKVCRSMTVALTMDARSAPDGRIFLTQRRSAADLLRCLKQQGIPADIRYLPLRDGAERTPVLAHLEQHLFTRQCVRFEGKADGLCVHAAVTPYAEAAYIARTLRQWHEEGIPWQHMAVAMADGTSMPGILSTTLTATGIPHYVARKDSAIRHGLCRMLLGALRCATGGYATRDVLHMAKSGFSPLTEEEAHRIENYALENGVDHQRWLKPFTRGDAEMAEPLRQKLIAPAERLREQLRNARTATQSAGALFALLEDVNAYQTLLRREEALLQAGMAAEAAENRQVWQIVMALLDQLHALLGERRAAMKDIARFVTSGLTGASIASLPPQPDTVLLGEAGHLLTGRIDALILCGMQDGVMGSSQSSLLTEGERRMLSDAAERPIGLTKQETAALRQSDFYRTVALPRKRLTITFAQGGQDGTALRPAGIIDDLRGLFPDLTVSGGVLTGGDEPPLSPQQALDGIAVRLRALSDGACDALDPAWLNALRWLWQSPVWHERVRQVALKAVLDGSVRPLPTDITRRIFTQDTVSISRLERFAGCPYQHYVDYGLKPVQRAAWAFEANDAGEFYHAALQGFAHAALRHPNWPELPDEEIDSLMDEVLAPLTAQWADGPLADTPAQQLQGRKYIRTAKRAAWLFTRQAKGSRFVTVGEEVPFGTADGLPAVVLELGDGRQVGLRGKIDRVDCWDGAQGRYLRVIDYKSSNRKIDPTRLWHGLQLQLMLYLRAASSGLQGDAAGAFYFTVRDPLVEAADDKDAADKAIAKQLQLRGVVLADADVVEAMDASGTALGSVFTKKGEVSANASAYSPAEMQALLRHTEREAAALTDAIRAGNISVSPVKIRDWSACQQCVYSAVCGVDPELPGCRKRELAVLSRQELQSRLANDTDAASQDAKNE